MNADKLASGKGLIWIQYSIGVGTLLLIVSLLFNSIVGHPLTLQAVLTALLLSLLFVFYLATNRILVIRHRFLTRADSLQTRIRSIADVFLYFMLVTGVATLLFFMVVNAVWLMNGYVIDTAQREQIAGVLRTHLALVSILLASVGVAGTWWAKNLQEQVKDVRKELAALEANRTLVAQNVLMSAEIAVLQLMPQPGETRQIPTGIVQGLRHLEDIFSPDSSCSEFLKETLDRSENCIMLRLAYGLYLFGCDPDCSNALSVFNEARKSFASSLENRPQLQSQHIAVTDRAAIAWRQRKEFDEAIALYRPFLAPAFDTPLLKAIKIRALTGMLIVELSRTDLWIVEKGETKNTVKIQPLENPGDVLSILGKICDQCDGIAGGVVGVHLPPYTQYYVVKAFLRLSVRHQTQWADFFQQTRRADFTTSSWDTYTRVRTDAAELADERARAQHVIGTLAENVYRIYKKEYDRHEQRSLASTNDCPFIMANYMFCLGVLKIAQAHFVQGERAASLRNATNTLNELMKKMSAILYHADMCRLQLPEYYRPTIFSELEERQIPVEDFKKELTALRQNYDFDV